jgi:hypothetical protein
MDSMHLLLKWGHIVAMVYWLGGEWGVFQTSYHVTNPRLPLDERKRHMETAYRIDILARTGIIMLLPLGIHMGYNFGVQPLGGHFLTLVWLLTAAWLSLTWMAFVKRETNAGITLTLWDERIRYVLIPLLAGLAIWSFVAKDGPLGGPEGSWSGWYPAKVFLYSLMLVIGLILRFVMRHWTLIFRQLAAGGPREELEARLNKEIGTARKLAYVYWVGILSIAYIGVAKPF